MFDIGVDDLEDPIKSRIQKGSKAILYQNRTVMDFLIHFSGIATRICINIYYRSRISMDSRVTASHLILLNIEAW